MHFGLHRCFFIGAVFGFVSVLAVLAIGVLPIPLGGRALLCFLVLVLAGLRWRTLAPVIAAIRIERGGDVSVQLPGGVAWFPVQLLPGAFVHPLLAVVGVRMPSGALLRLVVGPRSMSPEDSRRFRVVLRWLTFSDGDA